MFKQTITAVLLAAIGGFAQAQDGVLLDLLVKKKIINAQEAEAVRADLMKEQAATSADKIVVGSWIKEMKIGGDFRMRYQYDNLDFQVDPPGKGGSPTGAQRSRFRFRLRLYDEFKLADNWFGGVGLATNPSADSPNQTLGNGFGKYGIYINKAYLGWNAGDWGTVVAGKQANPFYTTELVWDPDISPDGFTESIRFHKIFAAASEGGYANDGKTFVASTPTPLPWELTLNLGEFIFSDNIENGNVLGVSEPGLRDNDVSNDAWLFEAQLVGSYNLAKNVKTTVAPAIMFYNAARVSLPAGTNDNQFSDTAPTVLPDGSLSFLGETRDLVILQVPGDISFKLGSLPAKFYWDFAWNADGRRRAEEIYKLTSSGKKPGTVNTLHNGEDDFAYLVGMQFGENKKKGDLSFTATWRQTGITAVDPNINDNDFAFGLLNMRGVKGGLFYNLTDFAVFSTCYSYAWNLRDNLVGGAAASVNSGLAAGNVAQVLQVDLNVKF